MHYTVTLDSAEFNRHCEELLREVKEFGGDPEDVWRAFIAYVEYFMHQYIYNMDVEIDVAMIDDIQAKYIGLRIPGKHLWEVFSGLIALHLGTFDLIAHQINESTLSLIAVQGYWSRHPTIVFTCGQI